MVRLNTKPEIIELGGAVNVALTRSQSAPHTYHLTVELETPMIHKGFGLMERTIICSCRGFTNHKKCFHVEHLQGQQAARQQQETNVYPDDEQEHQCNPRDAEDVPCQECIDRVKEENDRMEWGDEERQG